MKQYRTRPGVVLTEIAGQYLLISSKDVRKLCPYMMLINETAAFCWRVLEQGADLDALARALSAEYKIDDQAELYADLEQLLAQLLEKNYLIEEP